MSRFTASLLQAMRFTARSRGLTKLRRRLRFRTIIGPKAASFVSRSRRSGPTDGGSHVTGDHSTVAGLE